MLQWTKIKGSRAAKRNWENRAERRNKKREFMTRCCWRCQDRQQRGKIAETKGVWKNVTSRRSGLVHESQASLHSAMRVDIRTPVCLYLMWQLTCGRLKTAQGKATVPVLAASTGGPITEASLMKWDSEPYYSTGFVNKTPPISTSHDWSFKLTAWPPCDQTQHS